MVYRLDDLRDEGKHFTVPVTLLKPKFSTQSPRVRALHDGPAFPPQERLARIQRCVGFLDGAVFAGVPVRLGRPAHVSRRIFSLPSVLFGPEESLHRLDPEPSRVGDAASGYRPWGPRKLGALRDYGPARKAAFANPCLLYPEELDQGGLREAFVEQTSLFCREYGKVEFKPELESYPTDSHARDIIRKLKTLEKGGHVGFVLVALPSDSQHADWVHVAAKAGTTLLSKCFSVTNLKRRAGDARRLRAYVDRNALGMLVENGTRPWCLAEDLTYEVHVGFDVARGSRGALMGATMITNRGADIIFDKKEIDLGERIPGRIIEKQIAKFLRRFAESEGRSPTSILLHRDGRFPEEEIAGARAAIHKFCTSRPEKPKISVELVGFDIPGDHDLTAALKDVFYLCQLNWTSPEIDNRLPITLRLTDEMLGRLAVDVEEAVDEDEWEEDEDTDSDL